MPLFISVIVGLALIWSGVYLVSAAIWDIKNSGRAGGAAKIVSVAITAIIYVVTIFK